MKKRSYDQYCPLARSLDLLGERWTLLVVRDLIAGPRRYTDLRNELDGIPSDLLTQRLRDLEAAGIVARRKLPPPAAASVYELTDRGRELEPALVGLARFGIGLLEEPPSPDDPPSPERFGLLLRVLFEEDDAPEKREAVLVDDGERRLRVEFGAGRFGVEEIVGEARDVSATLRGSVPDLYEVLVGRRELEDALESGALATEGSEQAIARFTASFPPPQAVAVA